MADHKHLTLDERIIIETRLAEKQSISSIANELGRTVSTISREIKRSRNQTNWDLSN